MNVFFATFENSKTCPTYSFAFCYSVRVFFFLLNFRPSTFNFRLCYKSNFHTYLPIWNTESCLYFSIFLFFVFFIFGIFVAVFAPCVVTFVSILFLIHGILNAELLFFQRFIIVVWVLHMYIFICILTMAIMLHLKNTMITLIRFSYANEECKLARKMALENRISHHFMFYCILFSYFDCIYLFIGIFL